MNFKAQKTTKISNDFVEVIIIDSLKHKWAKTHKKELEARGFMPKDNNICEIYDNKNNGFYLFIGISDIDDINLRDAIFRAYKHIQKISSKKSIYINTYNKKGINCIQAIVEGFILSSYKFDVFKSKDESLKPIKDININLSNDYYEKPLDQKDIKKDIQKYSIIATSVNYARELVNTPPNIANPEYLAKQAKSIASKGNMTCDIHDEKYLKKEGMNAMLAVSQASANKPRLIHLVHKTKKAKLKIALIGKGLTYDSGGLSLKPADYMTTMKADKSGGCVVLGLMQAISSLGLDIEAHGVVGAVENMVSGNSYRPDDILVAKNKKTIEVKNTDAEGRLVLADCLCYIQEQQKFDYIIDLATLTGACVVALGEYTTGIMGHNKKLKEDFLKSAFNSGELAAELPFNKYLDKLIDSKIADVSNTGSSRYGGSITAGLFLNKFIEDKNKDKWLHLDIAGPSYVESSWGCNPFGASGTGVRMVIEFINSKI